MELSRNLSAFFPIIAILGKLKSENSCFTYMYIKNNAKYALYHPGSLGGQRI